MYGYSTYDGWKTSPPEQEEYTDVKAYCDKCGCQICAGERAFVFEDSADHRVFCNGCMYEFDFDD